MQIIPIEYGKSVLQESFVFQGGKAEAVRDIVFKVFLIETEDRKILVDAGCETMPGFVMRDFTGTVEALKNEGFLPGDITDVIITHSHHDHIECVKYFKNAVIHIESGEYEAGKKYIPEGFKVNVFENELTVYNGIKAVKIGGHSEGSCVVEIENEGKIYVVAGDECYSRECLTAKIPTGSSVNPQLSKNFIEKYSDEKYTVLMCHDI